MSWKHSWLCRWAGFLSCSGLCLAVSTEAHASTCSETNLVDLVDTPYLSKWDAYDQLVCLEERLIAMGDHRALFASVYAFTTLQVAEAIDDGDFANTPWMEDYQTEFANHYRTAFLHYETGEWALVPEPWLIAFDLAESGEGLILQGIALGMNAHINYDLPYTLEDVGIDPNRSAKYADHTLVNEALAVVADEISATLEDIYGANYAAFDQAMGPLDEIVIGAGMVAARENAWNNAKGLVDSNWWNRWIVEGWIESTSTAAAQATATIFLLPGLEQALRQLEGSNPGSTFCESFPCGS